MSKLELTYHHFASWEQILLSDKELIDEAQRAAQNSHSPYSHFAVGAAARLDSGEIVRGANIESEVYPAGICAERAVLFNVASNFPNNRIEAIAIVAPHSEGECYPCGLCRQTILDTERRQGSPIRVIMASAKSATIVESASTLLPFAFNLTSL